MTQATTPDQSRTGIIAPPSGVPGAPRVETYDKYGKRREFDLYLTWEIDGSGCVSDHLDDELVNEPLRAARYWINQIQGHQFHDQTPITWMASAATCREGACDFAPFTNLWDSYEIVEHGRGYFGDFGHPYIMATDLPVNWFTLPCIPTSKTIHSGLSKVLPSSLTPFARHFPLRTWATSLGLYEA